METISETDILKQDSNELFREYLHKIKDLIVLDENSIQHIQSFTKEERMEIIVAMNQVILSLLYILDL